MPENRYSLNTVCLLIQRLHYSGFDKVAGLPLKLAVPSFLHNGKFCCFLSMDLFLLNSEVDTLDLNLHQYQRDRNFPKVIELAWHLRQRDSFRALSLCDWVNQNQEDDDDVSISTLLHQLRIQLILAEIRWLEGALREATTLAQAVAIHPDAHMDTDLYCDAHQILAFIHADSGKYLDFDISTSIVIDESRKVGDDFRWKFAAANLARVALTRDRTAARTYFDNFFDLASLSNIEPGLAAIVYDALGVDHSLKAEYDICFEYFIKSKEAALETGQLRRAVAATNNLAYSYILNNQFELAQGATDEALALARKAGWPAILGVSLTQSATTLRSRGDVFTAEAQLSEALEVLANLTHSRHYALAVRCLADTVMARRDYRYAANLYLQLSQLPGASEQNDLQEIARKGMLAAEEKLAQQNLPKYGS